MSRISRNITNPLLVVILLLLFLGLAVTPTSSIKRIFEITHSVDLPYGSSQLNSHVDSKGRTQFIFITDPEGYVTTDFEGLSNDTILNHGIFDPATGETKINSIATDVIPFHYNMQLDSLDHAQFVYIDANEEVNYIVYNPDTATFSDEVLTEVDPIPGVINVSYPTPGVRAADPAIALTPDDEPRIVFAATFTDDLDTLNDTEKSLKNIKSILYMARNSTGWFTYDLMENSNRDSFETELRILPSKPAIHPTSLGVYFAWTNKFQLASETRLQFLYLDTQFPDDYVRDEILATQIHQNIDHHGTHVEFRRPEIILVGEVSVLLVYGSEVQGGPRAAFLENRFSTVWETYNFDSERSFRGVDSMSAVKDEDGTIFITWSMKDKYAEKTYEFDAYVGSVSEEEARSLDGWDFARLSLSDNIDHLYPNINLIAEGTQVTYIESLYNVTLGEPTTKLDFITEVSQEIPVTNPTLGFFIGLGLVIGVAFLYRVLIMRIPLEEKEEELLPHMINLKDSIERD